MKVIAFYTAIAQKAEKHRIYFENLVGFFGYVDSVTIREEEDMLKVAGINFGNKAVCKHLENILIMKKLLFILLTVIVTIPTYAQQGFEENIKAAESGNVDAMYNLGIMYYDGKGVAEDYSKAKTWFEKAADKGKAEAMRELGDMYYFGDGVAEDNSKAKYWYEKACNAGNKDACEDLKDL